LASGAGALRRDGGLPFAARRPRLPPTKCEIEKLPAFAPHGSSVNA
jgi:hypothetical protein